MFKYRHTITALLCMFLSSAAIAGEISIENAWIREAPPVSRVQAAYMIINNNQNKTIQLISASSPSFKKIEFHETQIENGLTKMHRLTSIEIPKKNHVTFKPEAMHMMLFNPSKPLHTGEKIDITFTFNDTTTVMARFTVKKPALIIRIHQ